MKYFKSLMLALVAFVFVACGGQSESPSEVTKRFYSKLTDTNVSPEDISKEISFQNSPAKKYIVGYRKNPYTKKT